MFAMDADVLKEDLDRWRVMAQLGCDTIWF
jgi:hypothetical protein